MQFISMELNKMELFSMTVVLSKSKYHSTKSKEPLFDVICLIAERELRIPFRYIDNSTAWALKFYDYKADQMQFV